MAPREEVLGSDDLMVAIFCKLEPRDRHRLLPLVCQRWRLLSVNPVLLQQTGIFLFVHSHELPRLRSLCAFLQRRGGQHLRSLDIRVSLNDPEVEPLVAAGLSACAASLKRLTFFGFPMPAVAALPPSLTFLWLSPCGNRAGAWTALPSQLSALTNLRSLRAWFTGLKASGYEVLRLLPALRALSLDYAEELPACLSSLASLQSLAINDSYMDLEPLAAVLPTLSLTQLKFLCTTPTILAALTSQTRLRDLCCSLPEDGQQHPGLVGGEWLRSLRRLELSAAPLVASVPALAHATRLETAQVSDIEGLEQLEGVLGWAVRCASLRRLDLCYCEDEEREAGWMDETGWDAIERAQARRRDLSIFLYNVCYVFPPPVTDDED